jgi:hypothetical protein
VYLLARRTKGGKFSKTGQSKLNGWLETLLIGAALNVNPDLRNTAKSTYLKQTRVDGYLNDPAGEPSAAARTFAAIFKTQPGKRKNVGTC